MLHMLIAGNKMFPLQAIIAIKSSIQALPILNFKTFLNSRMAIVIHKTKYQVEVHGLLRLIQQVL